MPLLKSDVADLANTKLGVTVPGHAPRRRVPARVRRHARRTPTSGSRGRTSTSPAPRYNTGGGWGFTGSGGTGVAVRTLVRLGEDLAAG